MKLNRHQQEFGRTVQLNQKPIQTHNAPPRARCKSPLKCARITVINLTKVNKECKDLQQELLSLRKKCKKLETNYTELQSKCKTMKVILDNLNENTLDKQQRRDSLESVLNYVKISNNHLIFDNILLMRFKN